MATLSFFFHIGLAGIQDTIHYQDMHLEFELEKKKKYRDERNNKIQACTFPKMSSGQKTQNIYRSTTVVLQRTTLRLRQQYSFMPFIVKINSSSVEATSFTHWLFFIKTILKWSIS